MISAAKWRQNQLPALLDQVLSGASNFVGVLLVARSMAATEFGVFAVGMTALILVLSVGRSWIGTRLMLETSGTRADRAIVQGAVGWSVVLGVVGAGLVMVLVTVTGDSQVRYVAVLMGTATLVVTVQDCYRYAAISLRRAWVAANSDALWLAVVALGFMKSDLGPTGAIGIWILGACMALLVCVAGLREAPKLSVTLEMGRTRSKIGEAVLAGSVMVNAGLLVILVMAAQGIGDEAAGSLRAAGTLLGPVNILLAYVDLALLSHLADRAFTGDARYGLGIALALSLVTAIWTSILLLVPDELGRELLGETWQGARQILPVTALEYCALSFLTAAGIVFKVRRVHRDFIRVRIVFVVMLLSLAALAVYGVGETIAVSWSLFAAVGFSACLAWMLVVLQRERRARTQLT